MRRRVVGQVMLSEGAPGSERDAVARALCREGAAMAGASRSHAGAHLDLSVGGGDLTWDLLFEGGDAIDAFVARVDAGELEGLPSAVARVELGVPESLGGSLGRPGLKGVKRTLWLRVEPDAPAEAVARFEAETPLLAEAIPAIRNWRWSRLRTSKAGGAASRWTHLWEQEFDGVEGLQTDYMSSPVHWGYVDRWFDPEMPERIVDLWLAHLACPETEPVLSWETADAE